MVRRVSCTILLLALLFVAPLTPLASGDEPENQSYESSYVPINHYYPFNGSSHHPTNPSFNAVNSDLIRLTPSSGTLNNQYVSRVDSLSARQISNNLCETNADPLDGNGLSDYNWIWGQFLSHDISFVLTQNGRVDGLPETLDIPIPAGDDWLDPFSVGNLLIPMDRSLYNTSTGTETLPREFPNSITGWLDGSHVYGSSLSTSDWLRSFEDGKLKTSNGFNGEFLPIADPNDETAPPVSFSGFSPSEKYVAGDPRANEHAALTAMHVLFVREHNRLADEIFLENNSMSDDEIYQLARKINTAQMQYITYFEYLPSLGVNLPEYTGFDATVNPSISNSFATLAFRMGHSQITNQTLRLDSGYTDFFLGNITMKDGFWNPERLILEGGLAPVFRGAALTTQAQNDIYYVSDLRNSMFGEPGFGGLDMCAIDIQRGRDHGLPDYNTLRESIGLDRISNWSEITNDAEVLTRLNLTYPEIDNVDPMMGLYAESHLSNSVLGESMHALIFDQYLRLRDGDILYFENDIELTPYLDEIKQSTLTNVILRNSEVSLMQCEAMYAVQSVMEMDCFNTNENQYVNSRFGAIYLDFVEDVELNVSFVEKTASSGLATAEFDTDLMWSSQGPTLSLGDCNQDGFEDIWVGASYDHIGWESGFASSNSETYLFIGDGTGNFVDYTSESGLKEYNSTTLSATWVDFDNDGDLDLYQSNYGLFIELEEGLDISRTNRMMENDGDCRFTDITNDVGLGNQGFSSTSVWGDYDNDGDLDLFSMNYGIYDQKNKSIIGQTDIFYHNSLSENGSAYFEDFSAEVGEVYGSFFSPAEEDTVILGIPTTNKITSAQNPSSTASVIPNLLVDDVPYELLVKGTGSTWAGLMVDFNADGGDDLIIASDFGISPLYLNNLDGTFTLFTEQSGVDISGTAMGIDAADYDADGDLDYCQSNFGPNYLFEQVSDMQFQEVGLANGLNDGLASQSVTWDCNFIDVDLDGDLDLWFASGNINPYTTYSPNTIYINDGEGNFRQSYSTEESNLFHPIGKTMGSLWCDFDKDGDLDVVISESNFGLRYFENKASDGEKQWIGLDLWERQDNNSSSRIANGAIVDIYLSSGKMVRQVVKIGSGYAGTKDTTIHLGIPEDTDVEKVVILWKDGTVTEHNDLTINNYHAIEIISNYAQESIEEETSSRNSALLFSFVGLVVLLIIALIKFPKQD